MRSQNRGRTRTTVTLPAQSLARARGIARKRRLSLSAVLTRALDDHIQADSAPDRTQEILAAYREAFSGFSPDERALLDGVILEPVPGRQKA